MRLTRVGDTFTGEYSADGTNWTTLSSRDIIMDEEVHIGLAYTNQNTGTRHAATFSDLSVTGDAERPTASTLPEPSGLTIDASTVASLTAAWSPVAGAVAYAVAMSIDNFSWTEVAQTNGSTLEHTLADLDGDRRYFVKVAAIDAADDRSAWSEVQFAETRPGEITDLRITTFSSSELVLDWSEANGEIGYRIERTADGTTWSSVGVVGAQVPSFTDSGLDPATNYQYRVITLDDFGDAGTSVTVETETRFAALTNVQATNVGSGEVLVSWTDTATSETGFVVERKYETGAWETAGTTAANAEQFLDTAVTDFGRYEYRVSPSHPTILTTTSSVEHWVYGAHSLFAFDDAGDTLIDLGTTGSSQPFDGTNTVRVSGRTGDGLEFNGTDSGVGLGTTGSIHGTIDFTIGAWIQTSSTSDGFIVAQRDSQWQGWQTYSDSACWRMAGCVFKSTIGMRGQPV